MGDYRVVATLRARPEEAIRVWDDHHGITLTASRLMALVEEAAGCGHKPTETSRVRIQLLQGEPKLDLPEEE